MDVDFWTSRVNSANNISAVKSTYLINSESHLNVANEGEEDVRAWFPCPFCYVEIEVPTLCSHLQDEHCFDLKNAVCPICAATLGKDPIVHFAVHHAQSVKRRRKYLKSGFWDNPTAMIGKDAQEILSYLGTNSGVGRYKAQEPPPDPLLFPFLCNVSTYDSISKEQDKPSLSDTAITGVESLSTLVGVRSAYISPSQTLLGGYTGSKLPVYDPATEKDFEEKRQRAEFLQELVASTIF